MPNYLTKEEIRQWRSSLERITLEEYAKRLGKEISNEKETNDMVDKVYKYSSEVRYVTPEEVSTTTNNSPFKGERISSLAQQSFEREKEISLEKREREIRKELNEKKATKKEVKVAIKEVKKTVAKAKTVEAKEPTKQSSTDVDNDIQISFKKNLTPREQAVFEHFLNNKNQIVYAKELAQVLELPRDYVYKYIKNLRAKMNENALQNADNGGFVLTV